jgi:hypothetical protein
MYDSQPLDVEVVALYETDATGTGNAVIIPRLTVGPLIHVDLSNTATVVVEAAIDLGKWHTLKTVTASGSPVSDAFTVAEPWKYIRARCTGYTSGSVYAGIAY